MLQGCVASIGTVKFPVETLLKLKVRCISVPADSFKSQSQSWSNTRVDFQQDSDDSDVQLPAAASPNGCHTQASLEI